ncbi:unnamed protein product [Amoebophrya sp. A120]|nr:unnamed protein product [Amoebophrya sp. A120]|eukprot:GSA120T00016714001.1
MEEGSIADLRVSNKGRPQGLTSSGGEGKDANKQNNKTSRPWRSLFSTSSSNTGADLLSSQNLGAASSVQHASRHTAPSFSTPLSSSTGGSRTVPVPPLGGQQHHPSKHARKDQASLSLSSTGVGTATGVQNPLPGAPGTAKFENSSASSGEDRRFSFGSSADAAHEQLGALSNHFSQASAGTRAVDPLNDPELLASSTSFRFTNFRTADALPEAIVTTDKEGKLVIQKTSLETKEKLLEELAVVRTSMQHEQSQTLSTQSTIVDHYASASNKMSGLTPQRLSEAGSNHSSSTGGGNNQAAGGATSSSNNPNSRFNTLLEMEQIEKEQQHAGAAVSFQTTAGGVPMPPDLQPVVQLRTSTMSDTSRNLLNRASASNTGIVPPPRVSDMINDADVIVSPSPSVLSRVFSGTGERLQSLLMLRASTSTSNHLRQSQISQGAGTTGGVASMSSGNGAFFGTSAQQQQQPQLVPNSSASSTSFIGQHPSFPPQRAVSQSGHSIIESAASTDSFEEKMDYFPGDEEQHRSLRNHDTDPRKQSWTARWRNSYFGGGGGHPTTSGQGPRLSVFQNLQSVWQKTKSEPSVMPSDNQQRRQGAIGGLLFGGQDRKSSTFQSPTGSSFLSSTMFSSAAGNRNSGSGTNNPNSPRAGQFRDKAARFLSRGRAKSETDPAVLVMRDRRASRDRRTSRFLGNMDNDLLNFHKDISKVSRKEALHLDFVVRDDTQDAYAGRMHFVRQLYHVRDPKASLARRFADTFDGKNPMDRVFQKYFQMKMKMRDGEEEEREPKIALFSVFSNVAIKVSVALFTISCWTIFAPPWFLAFEQFLIEKQIPNWFFFLDLTFDVLFLCLVILQDCYQSRLDFRAKEEIIELAYIQQLALRSPAFWIAVSSSLLGFVVFACKVIFDVHSLFGGSSGPAIEMLLLLRLTRVRYVVRLGETFRHSTLVLNSTVQVMRLCFFVILSSHLLACLWFYVIYHHGDLRAHFHLNAEDLRQMGDHLDWDSSTTTSSSGEQIGGNTTKNSPNFWNVPAISLYLYALRDAIFMMVAKDRKATTQYESSILAVMGIVGTLNIAVIFGNCNWLFTVQRQRQMKHYQDLEWVKQAVSGLDVPGHLRQRIFDFYNYTQLHYDQEAYDTLFRGLSPTLNLELKLYLYADLLRGSAFFNGVKVQVIKSVVLRLLLAIYSAGDYVIHKNDIARECFFIVKGRCEVIVELGSKPVCTFLEGQNFGEMALYRMVEDNAKRTAWVRAVTFCHLAKLTRNAFEDILAEFPDSQEQLYEKVGDFVKKRYSSNLQTIQDNARDENAPTRSSTANVAAASRRSSVEDSATAAPNARPSFTRMGARRSTGGGSNGGAMLNETVQKQLTAQANVLLAIGKNMNVDGDLLASMEKAMAPSPSATLVPVHSFQLFPPTVSSSVGSVPLNPGTRRTVAGVNILNDEGEVVVAGGTTSRPESPDDDEGGNNQDDAEGPDGRRSLVLFPQQEEIFENTGGVVKIRRVSTASASASLPLQQQLVQQSATAAQQGPLAGGGTGTSHQTVLETAQSQNAQKMKGAAANVGTGSAQRDENKNVEAEHGLATKSPEKGKAGSSANNLDSGGEGEEQAATATDEKNAEARPIVIRRESQEEVDVNSDAELSA